MRKSINLHELREDLQSLLDDVGTTGFPRAKALFLKEVDIVDPEGNPIGAEDVDVEISVGPEVAAALEAAPMEDEILQEAVDLELEDDDDEDRPRKSYTVRRKLNGDGVAEDDDAAEAAKLRLGIRLGGKPSAAGKPRLRPDGRTAWRGGKSAKSLVTDIVRKELAMTSRKKAVRVTDTIGHKFGSIKHFKGENAERDAYRFGRWAMACMGHQKSLNYCNDYGIQVKGQLETVNSAGGYLVPDEFSDQLVNLRELYGVYRANAHVEPMASDTKRIPRRDTTVTASFVGEAQAGSESQQSFSQINLIAKKLMVLTTISNELNEDSLINLGDTIAGEIAYAFAYKEDLCGFIGDGTSTYGGIEGLTTTMPAGGICDTGTATIAAIALEDLHCMMGKLPNWADTPNAKWYMHKSVYALAIERLVYASGGVTGREISAGVGGTTAFGYPVVFTTAMTTAAAADTTGNGAPVILFGDLGLCGYMGDRRSNTISFSDSALNAFEQDEVVVRGTERFDIVNTNLGDATTAGGMVMLTL